MLLSAAMWLIRSPLKDFSITVGFNRHLFVYIVHSAFLSDYFIAILLSK